MEPGPALAGLPPSNNMGGNGVTGSRFDGSRVEFDSSEDVVLVQTAKRTKFVRVPRPDSGVSESAALVDQVSFTFRLDDLPLIWFTEADYVAALSPRLEAVFGFGVTLDRGRGLNFYESSFVLGDGWGHVCIGGQRDTCLVQLTGSGAMAAREGWERRLYDFLSNLPTARLTRVDLARDFFTGAYSVDQAFTDYMEGRFTCGGRRPTCEQRGNWVFPDGTGRTFYVGSRTSGKLARVYEKGKQLGGTACDLYPEWVRAELELHSEDRIIPFDVLVRPGQYLAGAYPAFAFISDEIERIATKQKAAQITVERAVQVVKQQCGQYLHAFRELFGMEKLFEMVAREGIPERLIMPNWADSPPSIRPPGRVSFDEAMAASGW